MVILAVDFGDVRTGIAVCGKSELIASPVCVITETDMLKCAEKTAALAKEQRAQQIVVGYPKNMNGSVGERAEKCRLFADELSRLTDCTVELWDERCTTVMAHQALNVTNTRGKKRKAVVDQLAAVLILESYLEYKHRRDADTAPKLP